MTVKSSISLSNDQFAFAKAMVESGAAPSISAVLQQGVELLRAREEDRHLERQALREILKERQSGPRKSPAEIDAGLDAMFERKRKTRGLAT